MNIKRFLAIFIIPIFVFGLKCISVSDTFSSITESGVHEWNMLDKLSEKDEELADVPVSIGSREISYYENRISFVKTGKKSLIRKRFSDKERIIGMKLLDIKTGEVRIITVRTKITSDGVRIVSPSGYRIEIIERPNGIRWNFWNTAYRVTVPKNMAVIKNNFPRKDSMNATRGFLYVPYSDYFDQEKPKDALLKAGKDYDKDVVAKAFSLLRERNVRSKAFPNKRVVDVEALSPRFFERLVLLEQGDMTEFIIDSQKTTERVLIILGANRENAWIHTCNRAAACGWIQFTPRTYSYMRHCYPSACLPAHFKKAAGNHVNSIMAAILLHDNNLANLMKRRGRNIVNDPRLEEYLAASYNGSPRHVWNSLGSTSNRTDTDWTTRLKPETLGFIFKLRYLIRNELP